MVPEGRVSIMLQCAAPATTPGGHGVSGRGTRGTDRKGKKKKKRQKKVQKKIAVCGPPIPRRSLPACQGRPQHTIWEGILETLGAAEGCEFLIADCDNGSFAHVANLQPLMALEG